MAGGERTVFLFQRPLLGPLVALALVVAWVWWG